MSLDCLLRVFTPITIRVIGSIYAHWGSTKYLEKCMVDVNLSDRHGVPRGHLCPRQASCPFLTLTGLVNKHVIVMRGTPDPTYNTYPISTLHPQYITLAI